MIFSILFAIFVAVINTVFSWLPVVTSLPTIGGFNLDAALVTGMGQFWTYANAFWYVSDVFVGFTILLTYYGIKLVLKLILGHRAPGGHH